jgi:hypothetical protein
LLHDRCHQPVAPAGSWRVTLRNNAKPPLRLSICVQTDQSITPHAQTGLLARLEHPDYRRYDETTGRILDSCDNPASFAKGIPDISAVVRRHGSINATAASNDVIAVAGYRRSDGRPADYSATGHGVALDPHHGRPVPSVALPTDDSPALFGVLGAGASNGSVVAMRGTSFASASATRLIAEELKAGGAARRGLQARLAVAAAAAEKAKPLHYGPTPDAVKIGSGRMSPVPSALANRGT